MKKTSFFGVGGVVSADIAVPDHEREVAFYSSILTTGSSPLWQNDLMNNLGMPIIGLGARTPEYADIPQQWMPHFQVADVALSAERAVALGGREIMHGKSDSGESLWAALTDPDGAAFGVIPVVDPSQAPKEQRWGCIAWLSLHSPELSATCDFYAKVIGWELASEDVNDRCEMLVEPGVSAAEIRKAGDDQDPLAGMWLIHLPVGDLAESLSRVVEGGGEVVHGSASDGSAVIRDPGGVMLVLQAEEV